MAENVTAGEPMLPIKGIRSPSMVDELHKSVAVVYLQGCNFDCSFCHNSSLIPPADGNTSMARFSELERNLEDNFLIDGVVFTGGEPTLHKHLDEFIKRLHGRYEVLAIDTNGSNPAVLKRLSPLLSRIAMDIKTTPEKYRKVVNRPIDPAIIMESIDFLCSRTNEAKRVEFRTTYIPELISLDDIMEIAGILSDHGFTSNATSRYVIQQYVANEGVREKFRQGFTTVSDEKLEIIARNVAKLGIPVAIRCQERGFVDFSSN